MNADPTSTDADGADATQSVREYYNGHIRDEDERLRENRFELPVTLRYIERYVRPGEKVLDAACGTGHYAHLFLDRGYQLGLNDLSERNLALTLERTGAHPAILHRNVSNALHSGIWEKEQWDAVLLLGPMYHMPDRSERLALLYGLKSNPGGINNEWGALQLWHTGTDNEFIEATKWFVNAYFSFPGEIAPLLAEAGLEPMHLAGIEGVFGENMHLFHRLSAPLRRKWMEFILDHCEDLHMVHASKHLLSVSRRNH